MERLSGLFYNTMKEKSRLILEGKLPGSLIRVTIPSLVGMFGMMVFNIVDTYFVGRLGSAELAAISFTFPVVMTINSLVFGIGIASMTLFSKAVGKQDFRDEQLLATASLSLGVSLSVITAIAGYFTIEPLFSLLGAEEETLPYIVEYMKVWYLGAGFMVIPMLGDSILRGLGDTFTPAFVMLTAAVGNIVLDPLLIFGMGPFPEMGVEGAAVATIASRGFAAVVSILIQVFREHLIKIRGVSLRELADKWKQLFHIGLPNSAVKAITPLGTAIFTFILSRYGYETVAGFGVAAKIESVFLAIVNAFTITATVFTGQNMGARNGERARKSIILLDLIVAGLGILIAGVFFFSGDLLARQFNDEMSVRSTTALYLKIVPAGYAFMALTQIAASVLNVFHKPYLAGGLSLFQMGIVAVPGAFLLSSLMGKAGVFTGMLAGFVIAGILSCLVVRKQARVHLAF